MYNLVTVPGTTCDEDKIKNIMAEYMKWQRKCKRSISELRAGSSDHYRRDESYGKPLQPDLEPYIISRTPNEPNRGAIITAKV